MLRMIKHNDFPKMSDTFDDRVRQTLRDLPNQPRRSHKRVLRTVAAAGLAASLCVTTAFAATDLPQRISQSFQIFFKDSDTQLIEDYAASVQSDALAAENDDFRLSVDSVVFDKNTGAGVISLHLQNKKKDGQMPFDLARTLPKYRSDETIWSNFAECIANEDGQLNFNVFFGESTLCGSRFYLNETRSTENDYYIEGAFIPNNQYDPSSDILRLEAEEVGKVEDAEETEEFAKMEEAESSATGSSGSSRTAPVLTLTLPQAEQTPYLHTEDGNIRLSSIGLHVYDEASCVIDDLDYIAVKMTDGSEMILLDEDRNIDQTLYAFGQAAGVESDTYDIGTYVIGQLFDLNKISSIILNGQEHILMK